MDNVSHFFIVTCAGKGLNYGLGINCGLHLAFFVSTLNLLVLVVA